MGEKYLETCINADAKGDQGLDRGIKDPIITHKKRTVFRGYKTELKLNNKQRTACTKHAGTARFAYNWGLKRRKEEYERTKKFFKLPQLDKELNALKKTEFNWMYEVSKCTHQNALKDLDDAFKRFFKKKARYPQFKSRKSAIGSFRLAGNIRIRNKAVRLPKLGWLRLKEKGYLPTEGVHILSAIISERAGRWFISLQVEEEIIDPKNNGPIAGVDLGITTMVQVSDGRQFDNPRALKRYARKLKRIHREMDRRKNGSNNRKKSIRKLQKIHARMSNIRWDALHKATTWLTKNKSVIGMEDLKVSHMTNICSLNKALRDVGIGHINEQLRYKTLWYNTILFKADKWYPSSKTCSRCGHVKSKMGLSERHYLCEKCGLMLNRDLNAAKNLEQLAVSWTERVNACERRKLWPSYHSGMTSDNMNGETTFDDAGSEHHLAPSTTYG